MGQQYGGVHIMRKAIGKSAAAAVVAAALVLGGAGMASAGSANLGSKTCTGSSSVSSKAFGNYKITFNAYIPNIGAKTINAGTDSNTTAVWRYAYWSTKTGARVEYVTSGSVSNAGTLSNAAWFCDV